MCTLAVRTCSTGAWQGLREHLAPGAQRLVFEEMMLAVRQAQEMAKTFEP